MRRSPAIADVRGEGLFLGVELAGAAEAAAVVEHARRHGVLLSTDGPRHNVIKIKPPMVFSRPDADRLLDGLGRVLAGGGLKSAAG